MHKILFFGNLLQPQLIQCANTTLPKRQPFLILLAFHEKYPIFLMNLAAIDWYYSARAYHPDKPNE
jgi:hypothetical protein